MLSTYEALKEKGNNLYKSCQEGPPKVLIIERLTSAIMHYN